MKNVYVIFIIRTNQVCGFGPANIIYIYTFLINKKFTILLKVISRNFIHHYNILETDK